MLKSHFCTWALPRNGRNRWLDCWRKRMQSSSSNHRRITCWCIVTDRVHRPCDDPPDVAPTGRGWLAAPWNDHFVYQHIANAISMLTHRERVDTRLSDALQSGPWTVAIVLCVRAKEVWCVGTVLGVASELKTDRFVYYVPFFLPCSRRHSFGAANMYPWEEGEVWVGLGSVFVVVHCVAESAMGGCGWGACVSADPPTVLTTLLCVLCHVGLCHSLAIVFRVALSLISLWPGVVTTQDCSGVKIQTHTYAYI